MSEDLKPAEWRRLNAYNFMCTYIVGDLWGHITHDGEFWTWSMSDSVGDHRGEPVATFEAAQERCNELAFMWVLLGLADKTKRWCDEIDAELARAYRSALDEWETLLGLHEPSDAEILKLEARKCAAHTALMEGRPRKKT